MTNTNKIIALFTILLLSANFASAEKLNEVRVKNDSSALATLQLQWRQHAAPHTKNSTNPTVPKGETHSYKAPLVGYDLEEITKDGRGCHAHDNNFFVIHGKGDGAIAHIHGYKNEQVYNDIERIRDFKQADIADLTRAEIQAYDDEEIKAFNSVQRAFFSPAQIAFLTPNQLKLFKAPYVDENDAEDEIIPADTNAPVVAATPVVNPVVAASVVTPARPTAQSTQAKLAARRSAITPAVTPVVVTTPVADSDEENETPQEKLAARRAAAQQ